MLSGAAQQALFKLCSLDVAVRASEAWTQAAQFLAPLGQDYKHTGKPLPFKMTLTFCLKLLHADRVRYIHAVVRYVY